MNLSWSQALLEQLCTEGVEEFVFCAGARNSPLVFALDRARGLRAYSFFEERSASFFALGLARASGQPVAVITTSGTAVAELLPAVIESFHVGVPLILVTADRPRRLRGTGAPQAIDQTGLFTKFVEREFDLENGERPVFSGWSRRAPLHINVCFDEPLIDEKIEPYKLAAATRDSFAGLPRGPAVAASLVGEELRAFLTSSSGKLMVLVGTLETERERASVAKFLKALQVPTYFEVTSGLREDEGCSAFALRSGDKMLPLALRKYGVKRVLRLGGIPTARVWRDLEDAKVDVRTLGLSSLPFSGLSRGQFFCVDLASVLDAATVSKSNGGEALLAGDRSLALKLEKLFADEPTAEPSLFRALSETIPADALAYVGNSLPIREWDLAASFSRAHAVEANRGVNGIDGQVSTFLGLASERRESWCVIGDLTAMYDLAAPWACGQKKPARATIVVVNNGGGKIFQRIFNNELFENRHDFDFANWAAQWRLPYEKWSSVPATGHEHTGLRIVELRPDLAATQRFWDRYDALFV